MSELNELRKIAEAATPGPWKEDVDQRGDCVVWGPNGRFLLNAQAEPHWLEYPDETRSVAFDVDRRDCTHIATFDPPTVLALLSRLEQAEARVKLLESGIVADLVVTSVHSARAIGATVSGIAGELLKLGYDGLTERLEQAEQDRDKLRNRLDAMRRQRDGYRNHLRKTEQQIQRVREVMADWDTDEDAKGLHFDLELALDGETRRLADQGLGGGQDG